MAKRHRHQCTKAIRDGQRQEAVTEVLTQQAPALGDATLVDTTIEREKTGFHVVGTFYAPQAPDKGTVQEIQDQLGQAIQAPVRLEIAVVPVAVVPAE